jgi:hypothetical protein
LIVLLRKGVAAWMVHAHRPAGSTSIMPAAAAGQHHTATHLVSDETHAGLVQVIASMALAGPKEAIHT